MFLTPSNILPLRDRIQESTQFESVSCGLIDMLEPVWSKMSTTKVTRYNYQDVVGFLKSGVSLVFATTNRAELPVFVRDVRADRLQLFLRRRHYLGYFKGSVSLLPRCRFTTDLDAGHPRVDIAKH